MKDRRSCVAFVGPLPPPVNGMAVINQSMLKAIQQHTQVELFNRAPRVDANNQRESRGRAALRTPGLMVRFVRLLMIQRPRALYMTLSGGLGLIQDFPFAALGLMYRIPVYVHHHSFAYLDKPNWYSKVALWMLRRSTHIVLCDRMKYVLSSRYSIAQSYIVTLSNAAFLEEIRTVVKLATAPEYVIGFLSNITEAKGIFKFLSLVKRLQNSGAKTRILIGGPLAKNIESRFWHVVEGLKDVQYLGPLYGRRKAFFFEQLDLFVFPSTDENEAEPIVVLEAMRAGVPTLATSRGCIAQMLAERGGAVAPDDAAFDDFAFEWVRVRLEGNHESRVQARAGSLSCFVSHREAALDTLSSLVAGISGKS